MTPNTHPITNADCPQNRQTNRCNKRTKISIKIAALNIKGHGNMNIQHVNNKWAEIRLTMLQRRIGILVAGEAHMNAERRQEIERIYGKDLKIFYTKLPDTPNAAGVAIILNKNITNIEGVQIHEIVAGHALLMETYWHEKEKVSILAIYAPNTDTAANATFWDKIREFFVTHPRIKKPDFMLGDTNFVEEPLDCLPARNDPTAITDAFDELKHSLQLKDGWRNTYPLTLKYTYMQKRANLITRHSRLDRIYTTPSNMSQTFEWKIEQAGINTDHDMVSVRFTCETAPMTGKGRWIVPIHLLYDKAIQEFITVEGKKLEERMNQADIDEQWNPISNHQTLWSEFKQRFICLARERAKIVIPRLTKEIATLEARVDTISNDPLLNDVERSLSTTILKEAIAALEEQRMKSTRSTAKGNFAIQGETISRYWSKLNKEKKKRDLILRLQIPEPMYRPNPIGQTEPETQYEKNTQQMANMMRDYHEEVQLAKDQPDPGVREQTIEKVLNTVTVKISETHQQNLSCGLTLANVQDALKLSANQKAPGLDGICYEIWKIIHARYKNA
ncbi:hypothetical protein F5876DRAFT_54159, partial [Lentinula aff. lateritia]